MEYANNPHSPKTSQEAVHLISKANRNLLWRTLGDLERVQYEGIVQFDNTVIAEVDGLTIIHDGDDYIFLTSDEIGGEITGEKRLGLKGIGGLP